KKKAAEEAKKQAAAEEAKKKSAEEAKKQAAAEEAKKQAAAEEAKKKAAEEAKKQAAAEEAKQKAADEAKKKAAAEEGKKKAAAEAARKAAEDKKAQALAELLSDSTERQQALAESQGSQTSGKYDDLIVSLVSQQWRRPPSARNGMSVEVLIQMLPDGTITNARVTRSSGDASFDNSAVAAVRSVGRIPELRQVDRATFDSQYRQRRMIFKPEDLDL
ncbi:cell envelope integrity protein TolA, partial [Azotobacter beijerinckii]|uniref:cell envelope integrity protein TolA n=1 Tax=Azotobacter beijerinckii TaxID=170623 RepID=UPI000A8856E0